MSIFYLSGTFFYALHFPEKYYPKKYDICCSSHTFLHYGVVLAIISTFMGSLHFYDERINCNCL